jgi:two-component system response regulator (stage 0 sporulation protein A)
VLIADDNKELASIMKQYLEEQEDMKVIGVAYNGFETLTLIQEFAPDVVILDMVMPYLDGMGVLEKLAEKELSARPKIVILSAFGQDSITRRAVELGADYYLVKPFELETLAQRLRQMVNWDDPSEHVSFHVTQGDEMAREAAVTSILQKIGISPNLKGYRYLTDAILIVSYKPEYSSGVTKILYPEIAKKHSTTPSRVERAIRHAIQVAWTRGNAGYIKQRFGSTPGNDDRRPTNSEFIAFMADRIRLGV